MNISSTATSKIATSDEIATSITTTTNTITNGQYSDDDANDTVEEQSNDEEEMKLLSRQLIYTRRLIESCESNKENIKLTTNTVSTTSPNQHPASTTQPPPTVVSSVNICLFPDAPTTPKVVRKSPSTETSPTSVKALVKKFQLDNSELKDTQNKQSDTVDSSAVAATTSPTTTNTQNSTSTPSTYKTTCVFCLSCGGPGCRHSGTAIHTTKSTSVVVAPPPGMDQGIIC